MREVEKLHHREYARGKDIRRQLIGCKELEKVYSKDGLLVMWEEEEQGGFA